MLSTLLTLGALAIPAVVAQTSLLSNVTIFTPPSNYTIPRTLYARTLLLNQNCETDNVLLATWENYLPNNDSFPYTPIYQSFDLGETWDGAGAGVRSGQWVGVAVSAVFV